MKVLTNLSAQPIEAGYTEPPVFHFSFGDEPKPGFRRSLRLGPSGLMATEGTVQVAIPMVELWKLIESHEPKLGAPAGAPAMKLVAKTDAPR